MKINDSRLRFRLQVGGSTPHPPKNAFLCTSREYFINFIQFLLSTRKMGCCGRSTTRPSGSGRRAKKKKRKGTQQILHRKSPHYARLVINLWKIKRKRGPERRCKLLGPSSGGSLSRVHLLHSSFSGRDPESGTQDPDPVSGPVKRDLA